MPEKFRIKSPGETRRRKRSGDAINRWVRAEDPLSDRGRWVVQAPRLPSAHRGSSPVQAPGGTHRGGPSGRREKETLFCPCCDIV